MRRKVTHSAFLSMLPARYANKQFLRFSKLNSCQSMPGNSQ